MLCVYLGLQVYAHDLVTIGAGCCVDGGVRLQPMVFERGYMSLQVRAGSLESAAACNHAWPGATAL